MCLPKNKAKILINASRMKNSVVLHEKAVTKLWYLLQNIFRIGAGRSNG